MRQPLARPVGKWPDPFVGQSLANHPGRSNAVGDTALSKAPEFDDSRVSQNLSINDHDQRVMEKPGAGLLPKVQGTSIVVDRKRPGWRLPQNNGRTELSAGSAGAMTHPGAQAGKRSCGASRRV